MTNASKLKTFSFERQFNDLTDKYLKYRGAAVNTLDMQFAQVDSKVMITNSFIAMTHDNDDSTSAVGAGSVAIETSNRAMTVLDLSNLTLGGTTGYCLEDGSIQTNNNIRPKKCAGQANGNAVDLLLGDFGVTGNIVLHTTDNSWALLADRDTANGIGFSFDLSDGSTTYSFDFPSVHVEFPDPSGEAKNTSVMLNVNLEASQTDGSYTMQITKV